ncbi:MAG: choline dehydrogenase [Glaciimonas sp.]|nr:choline dehydrogenase [Glaciimonas sp.]
MNQNTQFDYIIVGAGSAGCVLANRLSADPDNRVCLLEAGPEDRSALIHTPIGIAVLLQTKKHNWYFNTEPEPELNGRRLYWPRGKTLGGSSAINAMIYMRGDGADYDEWAALGNRDWGWSDLLPLFKQHENREAGATSQHGTGGPLNVARLRGHNPLSEVFVQAGIAAGIPRNDDFNQEPQREGLGLYEVTQKEGRRWSAASAFLAPVRARPNLTVITGALASRIEFAGKRATGVHFLQDGVARYVCASREIILSGGAVNSPQLLLLSGVGPAAELAKHQIAVLHELPGVGQNLQDHLDITVMCRNSSKQSIGLALSYIPTGIAEFFTYLRKKRGLLATNLAESGGFAKTDPGLPRPDLQFHFLPTYLNDHGRKPMFGYGYTLHACQLRPKSRGHIGLHSANPKDAPRIQPNYLHHPDDQATMIKAVRLCRRILAAEPFHAHNGGEVAPGLEIVSDAQILADIRQRAETIYHPVGTCKMGNDAMAVVDARLRVHGLEGLRIADASIMPTLIGGNTNAPSMVIGEKAAQMILADAGSFERVQA